MRCTADADVPGLSVPAQSSCRMFARLRVVADVLRDAPALPDGPCILWRVASGTVSVLALNRQLVVGRAEGCDVRLSGRDVSRNHCRLEPAMGGARLTDLGSANGTWVNGARIADCAEIGIGSLIEVGGAALVLCEGSVLDADSAKD